MAALETSIKYPRRKLLRYLMRAGIKIAFSLIMKLEITGSENLPKNGPLIVIGNHFHFLDPLALIHVIPSPMEFVGGYKTPNAPGWAEIFRKLWGVLLIRRGASSRDGLLAAHSILEQKGILAIFPEGGSWASVLRPPRAGTAYLAMKTESPILPVGINGLTEVFPSLARREKATVQFVIGKPFTIKAPDNSMSKREHMDEAGHEMMRKIQLLIPAERHGFYSIDPAIREAARGTEVYPWDGIQE